MRFKSALIVAALFVCATCVPAVSAESITGQASIIDGDTVEIHEHRIRIWGIDAPESSQLCRGADSRRYRCGAEAANRLAEFTAGKVVTCDPVYLDRFRRTVAQCFVNGVDMAEWMVRSGLALDWPRYSGGHYRAAQEEASRAEAGIWAGSWAAPWEFRACFRRGGRRAACSDGEG